MRGRDKLLEPVRGVALLRDRAEMLLDAGCFDAVLVVLPVDRPARAEVLRDLALQHVPNPQAKSGMGSSIAAGVAALPEGTGFALIMPADMPDLTAADIRQVVGAAAPGQIIRAATQDGGPGSPVLFSSSYFERLRGLSGGESGRDVARAHADAVHVVPLPGTRARLDLDTPEAWEAWRKGQV